MSEIEERAAFFEQAWKDACNSLREEGARAERFEKALDEIVRPIWHLQERAKIDGHQINGHEANVLANDPEYLRGIARAALSHPTTSARAEK